MDPYEERDTFYDPDEGAQDGWDPDSASQTVDDPNYPRNIEGNERSPYPKGIDFAQLLSARNWNEVP